MPYWQWHLLSFMKAVASPIEWEWPVIELAEHTNIGYQCCVFVWTTREIRVTFFYTLISITIQKRDDWSPWSVY